MTTRLGIIGCGAVARRYHLPAFNDPNIEVVGFASRTRGSAELAASEHGSGTAYDDWEDLLTIDVDAIDICSPNRYHRDQAVKAAQAGKHVLVEKPIARTVAEADEMIAAASEAGVVLHVAHNVRYLAPVLAARDAVRTGRIGRIVSVRAAFGHTGPKDWAPDSTWFFNAELAGGGALIDLGVHIIDVVRFVTDLEAEQVSAMTIGTEAVEDAAHVLVRYTNGVAGTISASWVARPAPDMVLTVFGELGTLHFDARTPLTLLAATGEKEKVELPEVSATPYADFARAVGGDTVLGPAATGADGRAAIAIVEAAYASARSGETVDVA